MNTLTLVIVVIVSVVALWLTWEVSKLRRRVSAVPDDGNVFDLLRQLDADLAAVEEQVGSHGPRIGRLEERVPRSISRTAVVAYDAFDNIAGNQSRSIALLNDDGDGIVISLLVGRTETLFFTKQVRSGTGIDPLSPEEEEAVAVSLDR